MPIDTIPILSSDYPLFDWGDHLQSYYALGEGELVSGFQKETWNAIIDKTLSALSAAGMSWATDYTTASGAKVTHAYGPLSATMFNSVRHNLDCLTPVGWGWAKNPNMRGYVGRNDFKGYGDYGMDGDLFYAEYLLELVRRLNLTLSIMKGTANLKEMDAPVQSMSQSVHGLLSLPSAPMAFSEPAFSSFVCGLMAKRAGRFSYMDKAVSRHLATVADIRVKRMVGTEMTKALHRGKQASPFAANLGEHSDLMHSISQAAMEIFNCIYLSSGYGLARTSTHTKLAIPSPYRLQSQVSASSAISAAPIVLDPFPMKAETMSEAKTAATVKSPWCIKAKSNAMSRAVHSTVFERYRPRRIAGAEIGTATHYAVLDSAWYMPMWVNGKLYIRQAYEAKLTDATLEVI